MRSQFLPAVAARYDTEAPCRGRGLQRGNHVAANEALAANGEIEKSLRFLLLIISMELIKVS